MGATEPASATAGDYLAALDNAQLLAVYHDLADVLRDYSVPAERRPRLAADRARVYDLLIERAALETRADRYAAEAERHQVPRETIAEIKARVDLADLLRADGVELRRAGERWRCGCLSPDHADPEPSMTVYADHAYCYGCGAWLDCYRWLMERRGLSFAEALAQLAALAGVALRRRPMGRPVLRTRVVSRG